VLTIETAPPLDDDARFEFYKQYQMQVHDESTEEITKGEYERFLRFTTLAQLSRRVHGRSSAFSRKGTA
jgi:arginyl-tRNA--protein-N-Asp/Glu arginylyltransferase